MKASPTGGIMKLTHGQSVPAKSFVIFLSYALGATILSALTTEPRLLSLIPPGSQLVSGMRALKPDRQALSLLILTPGNSADLADFFAITGADPSGKIHQVIFTASPGHNGTPPEHSLLASGHFDQYRIYQSAKGNSTTSEYRGISVLVISPFDRERDRLTEDRLLAIIDQHLAIFGSARTVRQEVERYLEGIPPDSTILQRLKDLRDDYDSWCLISAPNLSTAVSQAFDMLDPALAKMAQKSSRFDYGIRFGRRIELKYEFKAVPSPDSQMISTPQSPMQVYESTAASTFTALPALTEEEGTSFHGVIKISRARYDKCLAEISLRALRMTR
jgi:hypothetical protein